MYLHVQLTILIIVASLALFIGAQKSKLNATKIIKETAERVNKNIYTNSNNESATSENNNLVDTCGGIFEQPQFIIESPGYPSNYQSNLSCLYLFKGPYCVTNYTLQFLDFNVEDSPECSADRLEVADKDVLCGTKNGFKSYSTSNGILELKLITNEAMNLNGFRILVSRSICLNISQENATSRPVYTTETSILKAVPNGAPISDTDNNFDYNFHTKQPACCATTYSDRNFFLASPGFPFRMTSQSECTFTIFRSSLKVCRLRIHIHYFSVGVQDAFCSRGFLQIDGKLICGCHTGLKLVSPFDGSMGNTKVFRYQTSNPFNGFVMEVIQDECPKRYAPSDSSSSHSFNFYSDQINRVLFPATNFTRERLVDEENTEIFEAIDLGFRPRVVKHVYYFESPDYAVNFNKPRDIEETSYFETSDLNSLYPRGNANTCTSWGTAQWSDLNKNVLWQRMPKCNDISRSYPGSIQHSDCKEYNFIKGYFQSPGYPYYYPRNLNICYRFYKQQGFCKIRLIMLDFHVASSFDCTKDFLFLNNNFRYCGQSLANTFTLFDMNGKDYEEVKFITDAGNSGRGFRGIYEQIPCNELELPPPSFIVPTNESPARTTTHLPPITNVCSRTIPDDFFTIDIYDYGKDMCNFDVIKSHPEICQLEITFVTFDFPCDLEHLEINGKSYCGQMSGETISTNFPSEKSSIPIVYKRISFKPGPGSGLKLHLVGRQSDINCVDNESGQFPQVQRIAQKEKPQMEIVKNNGDVSVIIKKKYKEICGIVMNVKTRKLQNKNTTCSILLDSEDCRPITDDKIYVPYKNATDKLELKFKDVKYVENIEFKEITCDNKFVLR